MIKKNWKLLLVTAIITLLPIMIGLLLWKQLPDQMPIHWNASGEIDGWSSKLFSVVGLPMIMLAVQWLCLFGALADPKKANHSAKVLHLVLWIIPVLSVVLQTATYAAALGKEVPIEVITPVLVGLMFTIIGNYLPKCKQNYTIGIKLPWTLSSEENWNKTHRFAGRLWLVCGIIIMLSGFFGGVWILLSVMLLMVLVPCIYSYMLYRKGI